MASRKRKIKKKTQKKRHNKNNQFEKEKDWAIFQVRLGCRRPGTSRLQKKDATKFIKYLNDSNQSLQQKRQNMKIRFGIIADEMKRYPIPSKKEECDEILNRGNAQKNYEVFLDKKREEQNKKTRELTLKILERNKKIKLEKDTEKVGENSTGIEKVESSGVVSGSVIDLNSNENFKFNFGFDEPIKLEEPKKENVEGDIFTIGKVEKKEKKGDDQVTLENNFFQKEVVENLVNGEKKKMKKKKRKRKKKKNNQQNKKDETDIIEESLMKNDQTEDVPPLIETKSEETKKGELKKLQEEILMKMKLENSKKKEKKKKENIEVQNQPTPKKKEKENNDEVKKEENTIKEEVILPMNQTQSLQNENNKMGLDINENSDFGKLLKALEENSNNKITKKEERKKQLQEVLESDVKDLVFSLRDAIQPGLQSPGTQIRNKVLSMKKSEEEKEKSVEKPIQKSIIRSNSITSNANSERRNFLLRKMSRIHKEIGLKLEELDEVMEELKKMED